MGLYRGFLGVFLCIQLLCLPIQGNTAEFIGAVKATGAAKINGMLFPGEGNLFSGDRVSTGPESVLTLFCVQGERIRLGPQSRARFVGDGETAVVVLEQGAVALQSAGYSQVALEKYGLTVRSRSGFPVVAQIALLNTGKAQVWAVRGPVEIASSDQSVLLPEGQSVLISEAASPPEPGSGIAGGLVVQAQLETESETGAVAGQLVDQERTVVRGARVELTHSQTGVTRTAESNQLGEFRFDRLPPGRYTLRISKPRFRPYQIEDLEVLAGRVSSLGIVVLQGGGGEGNTKVIAIVAAAVGAAVGVALGVSGGDGGRPTAPLSPSAP